MPLRFTPPVQTCRKICSLRTKENWRERNDKLRFEKTALIPDLRLHTGTGGVVLYGAQVVMRLGFNRENPCPTFLSLHLFIFTAFWILSLFNSGTRLKEMRMSSFFGSIEGKNVNIPRLVGEYCGKWGDMCG